MNYASVVTMILTAIAALAMMIPGLNALESSLTALQETKRQESVELCYAIVARQRVPANKVSDAQTDCVDEKNADIKANFKVALDMISQFRSALQLEASKEPASAPASPSSSGS